MSLFQHQAFSCRAQPSPSRASRNPLIAFTQQEVVENRTLPPHPALPGLRIHRQGPNQQHNTFKGKKKKHKSSPDYNALRSEIDPANLLKNPVTAMLKAKAMNATLAARASQPPLAAAPTPATTTIPQKMPPSIAPRLEVQPYHEALKGSLTKENWVAYSEVLNKFLRGTYVMQVYGGERGWIVAGTPSLGF